MAFPAFVELNQKLFPFGSLSVHIINVLLMQRLNFSFAFHEFYLQFLNSLCHNKKLFLFCIKLTFMDILFHVLVFGNSSLHFFFLSFNLLDLGVLLSNVYFEFPDCSDQLLNLFIFLLNAKKKFLVSNLG